MSDRKQINKYYPPNYDWKKDGSINKYRGTHHLRDRAKKLDQGVLVVRFEMPYSVWCLGCNNLIGVGVRYNAEKKQVGNFFTTKILQFDMKCHQCDQKFIIETDPENTDYKIISGLRKRVTEHTETDILKQYSNSSGGTFGEGDDDEEDTLQKLEIQKDNIKKANKTNPQLDKLAEFMGNRSSNDYKLSSEMRKTFRESKKLEATELNRQQSKGIIIPLLKETQQDIDSAKEIDFKFNNLKRKLDDNSKFKKELVKIQPTITNNSHNNSKIEQTLKKKLKIDPLLLKNNNNNGKPNVNSIFSSSLY